jgi:hypothetical protein
MSKPEKEFPRMTRREFDLYYDFAVWSAKKVVKSVKNFIDKTTKELNLP